MNNIAFLTMEQMDNRELNSVGGSRLRARWLWEVWKDVFPEDSAEQYVIGKKYDVMIFQKVYWENMIEKYEGIKILDLCDPDWLDGKEVMKIVNMCDAVTTSTQALADFIQKFTDKPVRYIADRVLLKEHKHRGPHVGRARKIGWMGYSQNTHYLYPCLEFLAEKGLELVVVCNQNYVPPTGFDFVKITNYKWAYPSVHDQIASCDLYLAPERSDLRGVYKSNNKLLTAMALGVPVVSVPEDLDRLMEADQRNAQAEKDLIEIKEKWLVEDSVREMRGLIEELKAKKSVNK